MASSNEGKDQSSPQQDEQHFSRPETELYLSQYGNYYQEVPAGIEPFALINSTPLVPENARQREILQAAANSFDQTPHVAESLSKEFGVGSWYQPPSNSTFNQGSMLRYQHDPCSQLARERDQCHKKNQVARKMGATDNVPPWGAPRDPLQKSEWEAALGYERALEEINKKYEKEAKAKAQAEKQPVAPAPTTEVVTAAQLYEVTEDLNTASHEALNRAYVEAQRATEESTKQQTRQQQQQKQKLGNDLFLGGSSQQRPVMASLIEPSDFEFLFQSFSEMREDLSRRHGGFVAALMGKKTEMGHYEEDARKKKKAAFFSWLETHNVKSGQSKR